MTSTATTAPRTEPAHLTESSSRWGWIPSASRGIGLVATLLLIAALEANAGKAAGWGNLAWGVPLAIDTFVLGVLLSPRSRLADRLFALALVETTVVISAVWGTHEQTTDGKAPVVLLGAALATALVAALWRQDETIRREREHGDLLAAATREIAERDRHLGELERRIADLERETTEANATAAQATADAAAAVAVRDAHAETVETLRAELGRRPVAGEREDRRPPARPARTSTDEDRLPIICRVLRETPDAGKRPVIAAIRKAGHTIGSDDVGPLMEKARTKLAEERHHLATVRPAANDA